MPPKRQRYGWIPDIADQRDFYFAAPLPTLRALPETVDLRKRCPPVYDQGQLGSCTANAIAGALEFDQIKQKMRNIFTPSRLFIYYNERVIEGSVDSDSGAMLRDGIKSVAKQGDCSEKLWPYDVTTFRKKPSAKCYKEARRHEALSYLRIVQTLSQLKGCLAAGFPFVFGFSVYESFESTKVAKTGHAPMPLTNEQLVGGHAVMAVGYDDSRGWFIARNSWGPSWGMKGYFTLPYAYLLDRNLTADFWTIRLVE